MMLYVNCHIGAEAFPNALFGPASYALPVHLDRVDCDGEEMQLSNCNHCRATTCGHARDASVDCLGRTIGKKNEILL
jgi:hypothetical protein